MSTREIMENNSFYKWVWRLNGIAILLAILLVVTFTIYQFIREANRGPKASEIVVGIANDPSNEEKWVLGAAHEVRGTELVIIKLVSENNEIKVVKQPALYARSNYFDGNAGPAKNILFINTKSNQSSWLFERNDQIITATEQFPYRYIEGRNAIVTKAIFYVVVNKDTNNDGVKDKNDKPSFAVSYPNGTNYKVVIKEFDKIIGKTIVENNKALLIYQNTGIAYSMLFDLSSLEIISKNVLPKVGGS